MATSDDNREQISHLDKSASQVMQDAVVNSLQAMFPHIPVGAIRESVIRQSRCLMDPLDQIRLTNNCIDELLALLTSPTCTTAGAASFNDIVDLTQDSPVLNKAPFEETGHCTVIELDQSLDLFEVSDFKGGDHDKTKTDLKLHDSAYQANQGKEASHTSLPEHQASCSDVKSSQASTKICDPALKICKGPTEGLPKTTETSSEVTKTTSKWNSSPNGGSLFAEGAGSAFPCSKTAIHNTEVPQREEKQGQTAVKTKASSTLSRCPCKDCSKYHQIAQIKTRSSPTPSPHQLQSRPGSTKNNFPNSSTSVAQSTAEKTSLIDSASLKRNREEESEPTAINVPSIRQSHQTETVDQSTPKKQDVIPRVDEIKDIMRARLKSVDDALLRLSQRVKYLDPSNSKARLGTATTSTPSSKPASCACAGACACACAGACVQPKTPPQLVQSAQSLKPGGSSRPVHNYSIAAHSGSTALRSSSNDSSYSAAKRYTESLYKTYTVEQKAPRSHQTQFASPPAVQPAIPSFPRHSPHIQPSLGIAKNNQSPTLESRPKESKPKASLHDPVPRDTLQIGAPSQQRPPLKESRTSTVHQTLYPPGASKKTVGHTVTERSARPYLEANFPTNRIAKSAAPKTTTSNAGNTPYSGSKYVSQGANPKQAVQRSALETGSMQKQTVKIETRSASDKQTPAKLHDAGALSLPNVQRPTPTFMPQQLTQPAQQPQTIPTSTSKGQTHLPLPTAKPLPGLRQATNSAFHDANQPQMPLPGQKPNEPALLREQILQPGPAIQIPQTGPAIQIPQTGPAIQIPHPGPAIQIPQPGPAIQILRPGPAIQIPQPGPAIQIPQPGPAIQIPQPGPAIQIPQPGPAIQIPRPGPAIQIPRPGPAIPTLPAIGERIPVIGERIPVIPQPFQNQVLTPPVPAPRPTPVEQPVANPPVPADIQEPPADIQEPPADIQQPPADIQQPPADMQQPPGQFIGQGGDRGMERTIEQLKTEVLMLFPDVDPAYVLTMLEAVQNHPSPINEVCLHLLENANYPRVKKEEPKDQTVKKTEENIDFVKDYYKLPPCKDWGATFLQLQNDFRMLSVDCIRAVCTLHGYHYAPTRVCLEEIMCNNEKIGQLLPRVKTSSYHDRKILVAINTKSSNGKDIKSMVQIQLLKGRRHSSYNTDHRSYMTEKIRREVKSYEDYMKNSALEKDRLLAWTMNEDEYEAEGQLIECGCCFTDVSFENMVQCLNGDLFCELCLQRYAKEAIYGEGKAMLTCMTTGCESSYPRDQLEKCLSATDMVKYDERVREESIKLASMDDLVRCPHCDFAALLDVGIKVFVCQNTECRKETCRHCGEDWKEHFGKRCEEIEKKSETNIRTSYEERMSQAQIRTCHRCKTGIMKDQGCNKMTCRCAAKMCYICRMPNIDYNHFCGHARNPGHGCTICTKCSLWTDPAEDDARAVKELEKELEEEKEKLTRAKDSRGCVDLPELAPEAKKQRVM